MNRSPFGARTMLATIAVLVCLVSSSPAAGASAESDSAREQAEQILSDNKYGSEGKKPLEKNVDRLNDWLGGKEEQRVERRSDKEISDQNSPPEPSISPGAVSGLGNVGMALFWIFIAAAIGGIGYLIYRALRNSNNNKKSNENSAEVEALDIHWADEEKVLEYVTDAELLEQMSEKAEQAGQLDLALRYRFRAGLLRLNDIDAISFHPSVTNAQWQRVIDNESFNLLTRDFNDVTYGQRPCEPNLLTRARTEWARVISEGKTSREKSTS